MEIEISFHGPFRVATGAARDGVAATVDTNDLLPSSSLKGVMRTAAGTIGLPGNLIGEVFGRSGQGAPWHWGPVDIAEHQLIWRARIAIDPVTSTALEAHLMVGEEVEADGAKFEIRQVRRLDPDQRERHLTVLACSAAAVHGLGAGRRRGLGWVSLKPINPSVDEAMLARLDGLLGSSGGARA